MSSDSISRTCDNSVWESLKTGADHGFTYGGLAAGSVAAITCLYNGLPKEIPKTIWSFLIISGLGAVGGAASGAVEGSLIGTAIGSLSKLKEKEKYIHIAAVVTTASMFVFPFNWSSSLMLGLLTAEYWDKGVELYNNL